MPHPKPLLLVEDDQDYQQLVREALGGMFEVRSASTLAGGLACIEAFQPEAILIDLNLPDSTGYETFLRIRERAGGIPVVVLTGLDDDYTAVQAVEDGAQDYLVKSLIQPRLIARCVNMAVSRQSRQAPRDQGPSFSPGAVLAFIGSKGGVGTSTTAINIAALLAQNGLDTVAIEVEFGRPSTLSLYLDTEPRYSLDSLCPQAPATIQSADLMKCLVRGASNLKVLCPPVSPSRPHALGAKDVQGILSAARLAFRCVVLDLPPHIDESVEEALKSSDSITMIVDRESSSVHCAAGLMDHLRSLSGGAKDINAAIVDRTGLQDSLTLADIAARLKVRPLAVIRSAASAIALSQSARTPLVLLYPEDPFSIAHFELADRLLPPVFIQPHGSLTNGRIALNRAAPWRPIPESMYG